MSKKCRAGAARSAILVAFLLGPVSCSSSPEPEPAATAVIPDPGVQPGDVVSLKVWREPDMTGEFTVDDRGIVTLPLLGERTVAGMGPAALRDSLLVDLREYLRNPSVEVSVLRRVSILGGVNEPGLYPVDATVSLTEALGLAGGVSPTGDVDDIRLVRGGRVVKADLDEAMLLDDADVRSGDRIVVGEQGWLERNPGALIGSLIAAAAGITIALVR